MNQAGPFQPAALLSLCLLLNLPSLAEFPSLVTFLEVKRMGRNMDVEKGKEIPGKLKKPIALGVSPPLLSVLPTTVRLVFIYEVVPVGLG